MIIGVDNNLYVNDKAKNVTFRSSNKPIQYCIIRVDKKFYNLEAVEGWEYHMEREGQILNADSTKTYENRILIGDENIYNNLDQRIKGVQTRKDSCIARDMILTASSSFFRNLSKGDFEKWLSLNVEWLKKNYGDNCIYAVLHMDESTAHIHVMVSVDYENAKGKRVMSNNHWFGGKTKLSELQSNYSLHIQNTFKTLSRGLKGSKATHLSIKQYYNFVTKSLNEKDKDQVLAKAKNNELVEIQLRETKRTLTAYKNYQDTQGEDKEKLRLQNVQLFKNLDKAKEHDLLFKESMKAISKLYKIPEKELMKVIGKCRDKAQEHDREK